MRMLTGKKTYLMAAITVLSTVAATLAGQISLPDAAQLIVTAVLGATVRQGVAKDINSKL
jgi:hypothetical protein